MLNLNLSNIMMIHSICVNGIEVFQDKSIKEYITAQNAILATFSALRIRYDFQINTYQCGEDVDRTLSIITDAKTDNE